MTQDIRQKTNQKLQKAIDTETNIYKLYSLKLKKLFLETMVTIEAEQLKKGETNAVSPEVALQTMEATSEFFNLVLLSFKIEPDQALLVAMDTVENYREKYERAIEAFANMRKAEI